MISILVDRWVNTIKIISFSLAATMLLCFSTACGSKNAPGGSQGGSNFPGGTIEDPQPTPDQNRGDHPAHHGIAILGWGSLIWDPRELDAPEFRENGPKLPIQFSRISGDGRVTLVKDLDFGVSVATWYTTSNKTTLASAIENVREREGTVTKYVGFVDLEQKKFSINQIKKNGKTKRQDTQLVEGQIKTVAAQVDQVVLAAGSGIRLDLVPYVKGIIAWAQHNGFAKGVVWTDIPSNWFEKRNQDWSMANAKTYLSSLNADVYNVAATYINKAPNNVKSALDAGQLLNP